MARPIGSLLSPRPPRLASGFLLALAGAAVAVTSAVSFADVVITTQAATQAATQATTQAASVVSSAVKGTADTGDTAWMLTSSALVMLMVPGLALFYAGMVRRKNVLGSASI